MAAVSPQERIGTVLGGEYELTRVLRDGGMGVVFEAQQQDLRRRVAVKMIRPELATNEVVLERFVAEARMAANLGHPNVVTIHAVGRAADGAPYMAMEFLEGKALDQHLAESGPLSVHEATTLVAPVMEALEAAHTRGMVHRDVKPANIFLSAIGGNRVVPKLLDFGIARLEEGTRHTRTHQVVGTPTHMSPEQANASADIDGRADVWSMGMVLYEALTGTLPYEFRDDMPAVAVSVMIVTTDPIPIAERRADLPKQVADVVDRALRRNRDERYRSMGELRQALLDAVSKLDSKVAASPPDASRGVVTDAKFGTMEFSSSSGGRRSAGGARAPEVAPTVDVVSPAPKSSKAPKVAGAVVLALGVLLGVAYVFTRTSSAPVVSHDAAVTAAPSAPVAPPAASDPSAGEATDAGHAAEPSQVETAVVPDAAIDTGSAPSEGPVASARPRPSERPGRERASTESPTGTPVPPPSPVAPSPGPPQEPQVARVTSDSETPTSSAPVRTVPSCDAYTGRTVPIGTQCMQFLGRCKVRQAGGWSALRACDP